MKRWFAGVREYLVTKRAGFPGSVGEGGMVVKELGS